MLVQYVPVVGLSALSVTWFFTYRTLPTTEELLRRLHPDALKGLEGYLPYKPIRGLLESDKEFWRISGRYRGLKERVENAVCFVQLAQKLERDHRMPRSAVRCIFVKAVWQLMFSLGSPLEEIVRLFIWPMPHFCSRIATHFYWELSNTAESLNAQFGTENWISYA